MAGQKNGTAPGGQHPLQHGLAFLVSGSVAFAVDALALEALTRGLGVHPIVARIAAIALAMVAGWLMHRTFTFVIAAPPSIAEFLRYAGVAWSASAVNYGVFVLVLLAWPAIAPLAALVISSLVAMAFSYLGMRYAAFRGHGRSG